MYSKNLRRVVDGKLFLGHYWFVAFFTFVLVRACEFFNRHKRVQSVSHGLFSMNVDAEIEQRIESVGRISATLARHARA